MATSSKWLNSSVAAHTGSLGEVMRHVPSFYRLPFALSSSTLATVRENCRLDIIVRLPIDEDTDSVPVGVVSKDYVLLEHTEVVAAATKALDAAHIDPASVPAELRLTELGERMVLSLRLPDSYMFDPGDSHPMTLRLEFVNSVDGSTRFRATMGWFRLVCSNGLSIGVTQSESNRRHVGNLQLEHIGNILRDGIGDYQSERDTLVRWRDIEVKAADLRTWIDTHLKACWGFKAAARAFHIARCGSDVTVLGPYRGHVPTNVPVEPSQTVPGSPKESTSLFDISQVLAWLAKERKDVQEQIARREQIPMLIGLLTSA